MIAIAKEFHCSTCSQSFTTQGNLNVHRKQSIKCGIVGLGAHGCKGCGATFQYSRSLSQHGRFCGGRKCTKCGQDVYSPTSWTQHCDGNDMLEECCALPEQMPCPHGCGKMIEKDTKRDNHGPEHCFSCAKNPHVQKMQREMQMLPENKHLRPIVLHRRLAEDGEYDQYKSTKPSRVVLLRKAGATKAHLAHLKYNNGACELVTTTCGFGVYIIPDQTQLSVADQALLKDVAALLQQKEWADAGYDVCELCQEYHDNEKDWIACSGADCPHGGWVCRKASTLGDAAFNAECARDDDNEWYCPACGVQGVQEGGGASSSTQTLAVCHVCEKQRYGTFACSADTCKVGGAATCKSCAEAQGLPAGDRSTFLCCHCEPAYLRRVAAIQATHLNRAKARCADEREREAEEWEQQQFVNECEAAWRQEKQQNGCANFASHDVFAESEKWMKQRAQLAKAKRETAARIAREKADCADSMVHCAMLGGTSVRFALEFARGAEALHHKQQAMALLVEDQPLPAHSVPVPLQPLSAADEVDVHITALLVGVQLDHIASVLHANRQQLLEAMPSGGARRGQAYEAAKAKAAKADRQLHADQYQCEWQSVALAAPAGAQKVEAMPSGGARRGQAYEAAKAKAAKADRQLHADQYQCEWQSVALAAPAGAQKVAEAQKECDPAAAPSRSPGRWPLVRQLWAMELSAAPSLSRKRYPLVEQIMRRLEHHA